ncbi:hypothetical protein BGX24_001454 [Mortierella sp. AD032]|nr:hypothetical protein BGX24_001454 [Mortierella sp. AD032]
MENGVDPTRLFLTTVTPDNANSGCDHRRYWQLAESVDDIELLQQQQQQATTTATFINNNNGDGDGDDNSSYGSSDEGQSEEEEEEEEDTVSNITSLTGLQRKRVRFMKEIQIIPSSRMSSDDDDDLTLIDDSEDEDEYGDDGDNISNSNNRNATFCDIATITITNREEPTLVSEWKAMKVIESILALEEQRQLVDDTKEDINKEDRTPALVASVAIVLPPVLELAPEPATVALPPSPSPPTVQLPCPPLANTSVSPLNSPSAVTLYEDTPPQPNKASTKDATNLAPPSIIITTINTSKQPAKNDNNTTCISPRTLELISVKSQLHYWTETATLLRDQEQSLTLHIDQLVQVMADVIEKCQETEFELLREKTVSFRLREELEKLLVVLTHH